MTAALIEQTNLKVTDEKFADWFADWQREDFISFAKYLARDAGEFEGPKDCGCLKKKKKKRRKTRHGYTGTPTYRSWACMCQRCTNPNNDCYPWYGGRGIKVCKRWLTFKNFLADMGERPAGATLDRIDVNGNYEKNNCRWASAAVQARNKRSNTLRRDVRRLTAREWASLYLHQYISRPLEQRNPALFRLSKQMPVE
jgi:hypothetical protein